MPYASDQVFRIGVVTGSSRSRRVSPHIVQYVCDLLGTASPKVKLDTIDLREHPLPLFDDTALPAHLPAQDPTPHYEHEYSRKWSAVIRQYDGFIFVTPQYNWSIPASLKNALDHLYHEWAGKPAAIVTYGAKGGRRAALHLQHILTGLHMEPVGPEISLVLGLEIGNAAIEAKRLSDETGRQWETAGMEQKLRDAFSDMCKQLEGQ